MDQALEEKIDEIFNKMLNKQYTGIINISYKVDDFYHHLFKHLIDIEPSLKYSIINYFNEYFERGSRMFCHIYCCLLLISSLFYFSDFEYQIYRDIESVFFGFLLVFSVFSIICMRFLPPVMNLICIQHDEKSLEDNFERYLSMEEIKKD